MRPTVPIRPIVVPTITVHIATAYIKIGDRCRRATARSGQSGTCGNPVTSASLVE